LHIANTNGLSEFKLDLSVNSSEIIGKSRTIGPSPFRKKPFLVVAGNLNFSEEIQGKMIE
jgi:hypothetical protein